MANGRVLETNCYGVTDASFLSDSDTPVRIAALKPDQSCSLQARRHSMRTQMDSQFR